MRIERVELRRVRLPLVTPFVTAFGTQAARDVLLVRVETPDAAGWGECVALSEPVYSPEYVDGAEEVMRRFLLPRLLDGRPVAAAGVAARLAGVHGHPMAKAAIELAVLDAELRAADRPLAAALGATVTRVPCGVSVGMFPTVGEVVDQVAGYVEAGYVRIKLKIAPGFDLDVVAAVRDRFPDVPLQVDANAAYGPDDLDHLAGLDAFDLLLVEQPFPPDDLGTHARLAARTTTPVCLDESVTSPSVCRDALDLGATSVVNVKAGRVGGYLTARRIAELCAARGVPVWCGGMVETGIGRAANVALAAGPEFRLPGDVSASDRFYRQDLLTQPFEMEAGHLAVPTGPGLGVEVDHDLLDEITTSRRTVRPNG